MNTSTICLCVLMFAACGSSEGGEDPPPMTADALPMMGGSAGNAANGGVGVVSGAGDASAFGGTGGGAGGDAGDEFPPNCRYGLGTADFWLEGGAKTCVMNNSGYNVSLVPRVAGCEVPLVVVSVNITPRTAEGAVHDSDGNIISTPSTCLGKRLAPHESCGVQLGQLNKAVGTKAALVVCAAQVDGKVEHCTVLPPC